MGRVRLRREVADPRLVLETGTGTGGAVACAVGWLLVLKLRDEEFSYPSRDRMKMK